MYIQTTRFYKQIFLKRLQRRFIVTGRVPENPPDSWFGWLRAINEVSEGDIMTMVGLDAYMYLRYIKICLKLSVFLSFWGLLVLVPIYSVYPKKFGSHWDAFTISNVLAARWVAAIFGYAFAAYFCQLLLSEYNNFSVRRLQYFVNPNASAYDPDTPPQTYYTVMVERIPPTLRSAIALKNYFEKLFPDDVYHVEVALDLHDLNAVTKKRHATRDALEKEVAHFYATGTRPHVVCRIPVQDPHTWLLPAHANHSWMQWEDLFTLEFYGYEIKDSLNHYIKLLIELNAEVERLQHENTAKSHTIDSEIQKKLQERTDTRAAEIMRLITKQSKIGMTTVNAQVSEVLKQQADAKTTRTGLQGLIFGQKVRADFNAETLTALKEKTFAVDEEEDDGRVNSSRSNDASEQDGPPMYKPLQEDADFVDVEIADRDREYSSSPPDSPLDYSSIPAPKTIGEIKSERPLARSKSMDSISSEANKQRRQMSAFMESKNMKIAKGFTRMGLEQTKLAGKGAIKGLMEVERALEMLTLGAYYKYSSTAFVTFKSRLSQSIAYQMLLSHDGMEISAAPNPKDVIWDNVTVPRSQVKSRTFITNVALFILSFLWSSIVTSLNQIAIALQLPASQQNYLSVVVLLVFLLILPFIFDFSARYYECMKLESEIQNSIMTRYFYYQLVNVYVTVGFGGYNLFNQVIAILQNPKIFVDLLGISIPAVSLFFCNLIIVKIFAAVPIEMLRPWQTLTINIITKCMDKRRSTRRDLRTGAFFAWPMLYGWCYPQLMMVLMIMVTYSCIAPFLMPFCTLFFAFAYVMYKYQLLYVYINDYQSAGYMWYAVFDRSLISLIFASITLLGYLSLELNESYYAGPFYFMLPLPFSIMYFWRYCDNKFRKASMHLSLDFSKEIDHRTAERKASGRSTPLERFIPQLYRQPSLVEGKVYPEAYRRSEEDIINFVKPEPSRNQAGRARSGTVTGALRDIFINPLHRMSEPEDSEEDLRKMRTRTRMNRSQSINVQELDEDIEETEEMLEEHFKSNILPLIQEDEEDPHKRLSMMSETYTI